MKKKIWLAALICVSCVFFVLSACAKAQEEISISITNKEALTAEWIEEGESRTVELSITPDRYTVNNSEIVVTSDNSAVVKADGLTLSAMGGGTANVTVSLGNASDRVAITVMPKLRGISITNIEDFAEIWVVGTDRAMSVSAVYKNSQVPLTSSDVTVISSAPEVIEADGLTLKAKTAGEAEITVKYGDFTDSVSLSVVPALETFAIRNTADFAELDCGEEFVLDAAFEPSEYYNTENTRPVINCQPEGVVEQVEGYRLKAVKEGSATVTVAVCGKTVSFDVTVAYSVPTMTFKAEESENIIFNETEQGGTLDVLQTGFYNEDTTVKLLQVVAEADGAVIAPTVVADGFSINDDNTVSLASGDGYKIFYTAVNPYDETKTVTKTLTINVYRKVFSYKGHNAFLTHPDGSSNAHPEWDYYFEEDKELVPEEEQVVKVGTSYPIRSKFNIAPSKLYYAEVTFVLPAYDSSNNRTNPVIGMAHFVGDETKRGLSMVTGRASGNMFVKDMTSDDYYSTPIASLNVQDEVSLSEKDGYVFPPDTSIEAGAKVKYAVARSGNIFYIFINDTLIYEMDMTGVCNGYYESATVPGIFGDRLIDTTIVDIVFFSENEGVQAKINELLSVSKQKADDVGGEAVNSYNTLPVSSDALIFKKEEEYDG